MKKLIFILLCFCLMTFGSSARIIEVAPAGAWGIGLIGSGGGAVAGGPSYQDFADDFSTQADGALEDDTDWARIEGSVSFTVDDASNNLDAASDENLTVWQTQTDTLFQYVAIDFVGAPAQYFGLYARSTNDLVGSVNGYTIRWNDYNVTALRSCDGTSCSDIRAISNSPTGDADDPYDSYGFTVEGTGTSTIWRLYFWDEQVTPALASWGTCLVGIVVCTGTDTPHTGCTGAGAGTTAVTGCTNEEVACDDSEAGCTSGVPTGYADTGKYVGIYKGGPGAGTFDNWTGGDFR